MMENPVMPVDEDAKQLLRGYINQRLRVVLNDGRIVDGNLLCTDRNCNIVIGDCEEFVSQQDADERDASPGQPAQKANIRTLALAIVPGQHIKSISAVKSFISKVNTSTSEQTVLSDKVQVQPDDTDDSNLH